MAELSIFNAATHIKNGVENSQTSDTSVNTDGNLHQAENNTVIEENISESNNSVEASSNETSSTNQVQEEVTDNEFEFSLGGNQEAAQAQTSDQSKEQYTYDWKQEIGKVDKKEVYEFLGLNEFTLKMNDHLLKGGKAQDFISMQGIDFDTVPDEDLVRQDINLKYPNLSQSEKNRLYERKYGVSDELSEEEKEDKIIDLKSAAYQVRLVKKNEQSQYKLPEPIAVQDENYIQWQNQNKQQEQLQNQINNYYNEHPATKSLKESKRVVINLGEGVSPFNIVLRDNDATELTNRMAQSALYNAPMLTNTGELDVAKHQLVTIFEANPQAFISQIFNYGKKMGLRGVVKEGQNAQKGTTTVSTTISQEPKYGSGVYNQSVHSK